jgi:hypothetical protein
LNTLGAQPGGFGRDRHGGGNLNAANAIGEYLGSGRHCYYLVRLRPIRESRKLDNRRVCAHSAFVRTISGVNRFRTVHQGFKRVCVRTPLTNFGTALAPNSSCLTKRSPDFNAWGAEYLTPPFSRLEQMMGAPYLPAFGRCGIPRTLPLTEPDATSAWVAQVSLLRPGFASGAIAARNKQPMSVDETSLIL